MAIVYAMFEAAADCEAVVAALNRRTPERPSFPVQTHERSPLDGNFLPESATTTGENTVRGTAFGGVVGLGIGALGGVTLDIMGLTVGIGALMGLLTGILSGLLAGMMAGTRLPKMALREAALPLGDGSAGKVLVTVEVEDSAHVETVEAELAEAGGADVGVC